MFYLKLYSVLRVIDFKYHGHFPFSLNKEVWLRSSCPLEFRKSDLFLLQHGSPIFILKVSISRKMVNFMVIVRDTCVYPRFLWRCLLQKSHDWVEKILNRMFKWILMYNILNDANLTGFSLISSWDILYICPLASSWYTSGNLWMHSSFRVSDCPNFVPIDPLYFFVFGMMNYLMSL